MGKSEAESQPELYLSALLGNRVVWACRKVGERSEQFAPIVGGDRRVVILDDTVYIEQVLKLAEDIYEMTSDAE